MTQKRIDAMHGGSDVGTIAAAVDANFTEIYGGKMYGSGTVASLPVPGTAPGNAAAVSRSFVTDSTVGPSGNYGAVVAGGGANVVPVFSDGTNWRIG